MQGSVKLMYLLLLFSICQSVSSQTLLHSSETLRIHQLTPHLLVHESFLQTESFGHVSCNGMVFYHGEEAVVFDTPTTDSVSIELIRWLTDTLHVRITAVVATHFHDDCLGGLAAFHAAGIPSYANRLTQELAAKSGSAIPQKAIDQQLTLYADGRPVECYFPGEGHTRDNIVGYIPGEKTLFGGCLVKEAGASEGYTADGNVHAWTATIEHLKKTYPKIIYIIPGHGKPGSVELLDYTAQLFARYQ